MNRILIFFSLCFISLSFATNDARAQNLNKVLEDLKNKMGEVTIDKNTFNQSIEVLDETKGKIKYQSIAVNDKGESTTSSYELYLSDIDKNSLLRKPSGKKLYVSFLLNNKQKFIKYYKDDKFESYTDNLEILVLGSDVAQEVIDLFKAAIPLVKNSEKTWTSAVDALTWLQKNIGEVSDAKDGKIEQSFSFNTTNGNLLELIVKTSDSKGNVTDEKYNWNVTDLNKNKLNVKISGPLLNITLDTKNNDKYISYEKANELQNYISGLEVSTDDVDKARNIIAAFSTAIDKSKAKLPEFKTTQAAIDFVKSKTGEVLADQKKIVQTIEFTSKPPLKCTITANEDTKGKTEKYIYEFYLADADPAVVFKVSGKKVLIPISMAGNNKFIRITKDDELQNYGNDMEFFMPDIETAREVVVALNTAFKNSKDVPLKFNTIAEAMKYLETNVTGTTIGTDQYTLSFKGSTADPYASTYSYNKLDSKGSTIEESFLFYPYLLDVNAVKVEPDGKFISVNSIVAGKKSLIQKIKKEQTSFVNDLSIMSSDVYTAKNISAALRFLSANATPKGKTFVNKEAALNYVAQNLGEIHSGNKTIAQKLEIASDNPCKLNYTITTSDEKGKSIEEVYEFVLIDINKNVIDYKPSGAYISILLNCKNKQKLIKAYKDGKQQSFTTDVEFLCTDADVAKNLSEALKFAVGTCE